MSVGSRLLLGVVTLLVGLLMVLIASPEEGAKKLFFYGFGGFCFLIALSCVTHGRARSFVGSFVGVVVCATAIWYLASMLVAGPVTSASLPEPSVLNAILFLLVFGVPGAAYAWKVRFGFRRAP
jgi:hypothetical protein